MAFGSSRERGWDSQTWSLIVGWVWGIRVRLHLFFLLFVLFHLLDGLNKGYFVYELSLTVGLFTMVFLHELGHCFGCRAVGGHADDILLWPLGGLAFCAPPNRPYESLITTISGPAVNLALCLVLVPLLFVLGMVNWALWNPFVLGFDWDPTRVTTFIALAWKVNYWLLLFNICLPIFPFDGGRIIQELLWFRFGHYQATMTSTAIGMGGGVILAGVGLYFAGSQSADFLLFTALGIFGFIESFRIRKQTEAMGELQENEFGYDFSQGYTSLERSMKSIQKTENSLSLMGRFEAWQSRRKGKEEAKLEAELDRILAKIHNEGMDSLSRTERRILNQASKRRRR